MPTALVFATGVESSHPKITADGFSTRDANGMVSTDERFARLSKEIAAFGPTIRRARRFQEALARIRAWLRIVKKFLNRLVNDVPIDSPLQECCSLASLGSQPSSLGARFAKFGW
jgi:hypothetical protein